VNRLGGDNLGELMTVEDRLEKIEAMLGKIEPMLVVLVERQQTREWYTTDQFAQLVGKAEFTVREWCRLGRVHAEKRKSGRGAFPAWVVSHEELLRYQRDGLLPNNQLAAR
jgi:hypothetical protein